VEWALRNPDWWCGMQSLFENSGLILRRINFSSSFARIGNKLMGRYDFIPWDLCPAYVLRLSLLV
jgi:hypothetical protein